MPDFTGSVDLAADPHTVFAYLTTNEGMTAWMGQWADLVPEVGGSFAVDVAGYPVRGRFLEVDPPNRVVVSWGFAGSSDLPPGASTVTFTLTPSATGTRLEVRHSGLPDAAVPGHADGWTHFLPRLAAAGAGAPLDPDPWRPIP